MKHKTILIIILFAASILRFNNLQWGQGNYFHPDERNMVYGITNLKFPTNFNPRFFAYGQFPLYLAYFSGLIANKIAGIQEAHLTIRESVYWLRFWSATFSLLTVYAMYLLAKQISFKTGLITALFTAFTPQLIQFAHFGTTESLLIFLFILTVYLSLLLLKQEKIRLSLLIYLSLILGTACGTKVTFFLFYLVPITAIIFNKHINLRTRLKQSVFLILFGFFFCLVSSPYNVIDINGFRGAMNYESAVALGKLKVFYTRQFEETIPFIFQFNKILPYALGWPQFIFGVFGFLIYNQALSKKKDHKNHLLKILPGFALIFQFIPNSIVFTRWTRFIAPVFPLFSFFAAFLIVKIAENKNPITKYLRFILILLTIVPGLTFASIYNKPDTRVTASSWIYQNIPQDSFILSETANVIDIPIHSQTLNPLNKNYSVISYNFYDLDNDETRLSELISHLVEADYIFIPSRRIFANHIRLSKQYPLTTKYYNLLFSNKLGFTEIKTISSFPQINLGNLQITTPDEEAEETFTVFDHPVIRIYKKTKHIDYLEYVKLLNIN